MTDSGGGLLDGIPLQWSTFLDTPPEESDPEAAKIIVVPAPYDSTTSFKSGSRHGPKAIIEASRHLEDYDVELDRDISLVGIHTTPEIAPDMSGPKAMIDTVRRAVLPIARSGKLVALLGGEHTITAGAVQAYAEAYPDLSVLYLDAHADMRDSYMGTKWSHACVARRVHEICGLVEVGVRSLSEGEMRFIKEAGVPIHFWNEGESALSHSSVLESLSDHIYVSVDLDVFDPSIMSAVGTPEPGGMKWHEVTSLLKTVAANRRVVGFDIVELSPAEGPESCAYTAAKLAYKIMGYATRDD